MSTLDCFLLMSPPLPTGIPEDFPDMLALSLYILFLFGCWKLLVLASKLFRIKPASLVEPAPVVAMASKPVEDLTFYERMTMPRSPRFLPKSLAESVQLATRQVPPRIRPRDGSHHGAVLQSETDVKSRVKQAAMKAQRVKLPAADPSSSRWFPPLNPNQITRVEAVKRRQMLDQTALKRSRLTELAIEKSREKLVPDPNDPKKEKKLIIKVLPAPSWHGRALAINESHRLFMNTLPYAEYKRIHRLDWDEGFGYSYPALRR